MFSEKFNTTIKVKDRPVRLFKDKKSYSFYIIDADGKRKKIKIPAKYRASDTLAAQYVASKLPQQPTTFEKPAKQPTVRPNLKLPDDESQWNSLWQYGYTPEEIAKLESQIKEIKRKRKESKDQLDAIREANAKLEANNTESKALVVAANNQTAEAKTLRDELRDARAEEKKRIEDENKALVLRREEDQKLLEDILKKIPVISPEAEVAIAQIANNQAQRRQTRQFEEVSTEPDLSIEIPPQAQSRIEPATVLTGDDDEKITIVEDTEDEKKNKTEEQRQYNQKLALINERKLIKNQLKSLESELLKPDGTPKEDPKEMVKAGRYRVKGDGVNQRLDVDYQLWDVKGKQYVFESKNPAYKGLDKKEQTNREVNDNFITAVKKRYVNTAIKNIKDRLKSINKELGEQSGSGEETTNVSHLPALYSDEIEQFFDRNPSYKNKFMGVIGSDQLKEYSDYPPVKPYGIIMNTDPSYKPGEHWTALYFTPDSIEYYDSLADKPSKKLLRDLSRLISSWNPNTLTKFKYNEIKNQSDKSDHCGYFACKFLIDRFDGIPYDFTTRYDNHVQGEKEIKQLFKYI